MDELACEPSQVLVGLRPCPWWTGYCRSEAAALRVPCLTKACIFMIVHLTVITLGLAQWQLRGVSKIWLPVVALMPRSSTLPFQVPCQHLPG